MSDTININETTPRSTASSKEEQRLKVGVGSGTKKKKREIVKDFISNAVKKGVKKNITDAVTAGKDYIATGKNKVATGLNKRKILNNLSSEFKEQISGRENQENIRKNISEKVKEGKYGDAKKYTKEELAKITKDPGTTNFQRDYVQKQLKKFRNV